MKIKNNFIKTILYTSACSLLFLGFNTYSISASTPTTLKVTQKSSPVQLVNNSRKFAPKADAEGRAAYCMWHDGRTPAGSTTLTKTTMSYSSKVIKQCQFILKNGLSKYENTNKETAYMTGDAVKDYYITQQAISLAIGDLNYNDYVKKVNNTVGKKSLALYDDAVAYSNTKNTNKSDNAKNNSSKSAAPTITISPNTKQELKPNSAGTAFESGWYTVSVSNGSAYTTTLVNAPTGAYISRNPNNQNQFKIICPEYSVGNRILNFSIDVKAYGSSYELMPTKYAPSSSSYQPLMLAMLEEWEGGGDETKNTLSVYIDNCDRSPLPGKWIQSKSMNLTKNYNVKDTNDKSVGTLKINSSYKLNAEVKYSYSATWQSYSRNKTSAVNKTEAEVQNEMKELLNAYDIKKTSSNDTKSVSSQGCKIEGRSETCPERTPPPRPDAGSHSDTISYTIKYIKDDGSTHSTVNNKVGTGSFTISGNPSSSSTTGFAANYIPINVPNAERLVRAEITLSMNGGSFTVKLPIEYYYKKDIKVINISTSSDGCSTVYRGDEISVRADIASNDIRTENFTTKMEVSINGGNYSTIGTKKVYGVSNDSVGQVYYKYKIPENANSIKFRCTVSPNSTYPEANGLTSNNTYEGKTISVKKMDSSAYKDTLSSKRNSYSFPNNTVVSYIKVKKYDKTKATTTYCSTGCQLPTTNGTKSCPGHISYTYDTPYYAFVLKDTAAISGVTEEISIKSIKFRSKYTTERKGTNSIDSNGFIDLKNLNNSTDSQNVKIKSGYGFELKVDTEYKNNIPLRMNSINKSNTAVHPNNTTWSKYEFLSATTKVITSNRDVELNKLSDSSPVITVNPAADELPYSTPNQLFIKMPNGEILTLDNKLDLVDKNRNTESKTNSNKIDYRETITSSSISREKSFDFKLSNGFRKYYIHKDTKNNNYTARIVTPQNGIVYNCGSVSLMADIFDLNLEVYGGYTDDLKTHLNE